MWVGLLVQPLSLPRRLFLQSSLGLLSHLCCTLERREATFLPQVRLLILSAFIFPAPTVRDATPQRRRFMRAPDAWLSSDRRVRCEHNRPKIWRVIS